MPINMTTTILARDLKPGDVIDFGGQQFTVRSTDQHPTVPEVFNIWGSAHTNSIYNHSAMNVSPDQLLTVQRPDPDAELVEVMAKAIYVSDGGRPDVWAGAERQPAYATLARAALAAAREAGLL